MQENYKKFLQKIEKVAWKASRGEGVNFCNEWVFFRGVVPYPYRIRCVCQEGRSPQKGTVTSGGCQKKEHHFADYLMHFEMIYSHFWQNQTTLGLSDVQNKFAPLSFYVCHTNILGFEAFLSSEIWFGLSYSITIAAFCMPNILVYQDQESVHK